VVVPDSHWVTRAPWYSGPPSSKSGSFRLQGYHLLWPAFPDRSAKILIFDLPTAPYDRPTEAFNTEATTHTGLTSLRFRLFPFRSPLLGESLLISLPAGTEMFHFPAWASLFLCIQKRIGGIHRLGFPIRISSDHGLLAAPRGLSQLATSFIAC
jgi:hypothetical protein